VLPWRQRVVGNVPPGGNEQTGLLLASYPQDPRQIDLAVDWYVYTDQAGNQWLLEGTREGIVKPVAEQSDL